MKTKLMLAALAMAFALAFTVAALAPAADADDDVPNAVGTSEYLDLAYYAYPEEGMALMDITLKTSTTPDVQVELYKEAGETDTLISDLPQAPSSHVMTMYLTSVLADGTYHVIVTPIGGSASPMTCDIIVGDQYTLTFAAQTQEDSTDVPDDYGYTVTAAGGAGENQFKILSNGQVTFDGQTATYSNVGGATVTVTLTAPSAADKDDRYTYAFVGWFDGNTDISDSVQTIAADKTFTAKWTAVTKTYNVSFDSTTIQSITGAASAISAAGTPVKYGTVLTVTAVEVAGKTATVYKNGIAQTTSAGVASYTVGAYAAYFNAQYVANDKTVIYDADGGKFSDNATSKTIGQKYGERYQLPDSDPTRTGYDFAGWYTGQAGAGTQVINSTNVPDLADTQNVYAKWVKKTFTVTFNKTLISVKNGETALHTGASVDFGTTLTVDKRDAAVKGKDNVTTEKTAVISANGVALATTSYVIDDTHMIDVEFTIAVTPAQYTVTFNGNGDDASYSQSVTETYDAKYLLPASNPTKTGYTFVGWFTVAAATGGSQITNATDVANVDKDRQLYARWTINTYKVNFDATKVSVTKTVGSTAVANGEAVEYNTALTVAPILTVASGYPDAGYTGTVSASIGDINEGSYTMGTNDVVFTASFTAKTFTVTFTGGYVNNASDPSHVNYKEGSSAAAASVAITSVPYGSVIYVNGDAVKVLSGGETKIVSSVCSKESTTYNYVIDCFKVSTGSNANADGYTVTGNATVVAYYVQQDRGAYNLTAEIKDGVAGLAVSVTSKVSLGGTAIMVITNNSTVGAYSYTFKSKAAGAADYGDLPAGVTIAPTDIYNTFTITGISEDTAIQVIPAAADVKFADFYVSGMAAPVGSDSGKVTVVIKSATDKVSNQYGKIVIKGTGTIEIKNRTSYISLASCTQTLKKVNDSSVVDNFKFSNGPEFELVYELKSGSKMVTVYSVKAQFQTSEDGATYTVFGAPTPTVLREV